MVTCLMCNERKRQKHWHITCEPSLLFLSLFAGDSFFARGRKLNITAMSTNPSKFALAPVNCQGFCQTEFFLTSFMLTFG